METVGDTLDDFDLVVGSFKHAGMHPMLAVTDDPVLVTLQHLGEPDQLGMAVLAGHGAPLGQGPLGEFQLLDPNALAVIAPNLAVFDLDHHGAMPE